MDHVHSASPSNSDPAAPTIPAPASSTPLRKRFRPSLATWLAIFFSLPVLALGLWFSLDLAEPAYHFLLLYKERYTVGEWTLIVVCRVLAWFLLAGCAWHLGLIGASLWAPRKWKTRTLWLELAGLTLLVCCWGYFMLPSAALERAVHRGMIEAQQAGLVDPQATQAHQHPASRPNEQ